MSLIVDAFERMLGARFFANTTEEFSKGSESKFNSTSTVVFPIRLAWIYAARFCSHEGTIFWRFVAASGGTMSKGGIVFAVMKKTAAAFCVASYQGSARKLYSFPAFTSANPDSSALDETSVVQNLQPAKSLAGVILSILSARHRETLA